MVPLQDVVLHWLVLGFLSSWFGGLSRLIAVRIKLIRRVRIRLLSHHLRIGALVRILYKSSFFIVGDRVGRVVLYDLLVNLRFR